MTKPRKPLTERVKAYLARHGGNAEAAVTELLTDNLRYRDRIRTLETGESPYKPDARVTELERDVEDKDREIDRLSALIPAQGSVVLTADDAKLWESYKTFGKPDDVKKQLEELPTLRTKVADGETKTTAEQAAKLLGWNTVATSALIADKKLTLTFVDGKDAQGKDIKVPHVRPAGDEKAQTKPIADWVKDNASYLTPALAAKDGTTQQTTPNTGTTVLPFPTQTSSQNSSDTPSDPVAAFMKQSQDERNAAPNPLIPRKSAGT